MNASSGSPTNRVDGFSRMDISTSIDDDPKFRALWRLHPDLYSTGFTGYVGLCARSWREPDRMTAIEGWPTFPPYDSATVAALQEVRLLDAETRIPVRTWEHWFEAAVDRRQRGRDADAAYNRKRRGAVRQADSQGSQTVSQTVTSSSRLRHVNVTGQGEPCRQLRDTGGGGPLCYLQVGHDGGHASTDGETWA